MSRQGSSGFLPLDEGEVLTSREAEVQRLARTVYEGADRERRCSRAGP